MKSIDNRKRKGMSLEDMAKELTRQRDAKRDFVANTKEIKVEADSASPTKLTMQVGTIDKFPVRRHAIRQIGAQLKIPAPFVDRLAKDHPDMLAWNVNKLFEREPADRMIRTLDGDCRAYLSDKYRPLDNFDFANAVLPKLIENKADVTSCDISETRLYIKYVLPGIEKIVAKAGTYHGDGGHNPIHRFKPGGCVSNSEVGAGSLAVEPGVHEVDCSNLLVMGSNAMRKYHVGKKLYRDDELYEMFTTATKSATDRAFWMQVADLVDAGLDGTMFQKMVAECEAKMNGTEIEKPSVAVRELPNTTEAEQEGILASLIKGGDLSQFGMQWAITHYAQNEDVSYERQVELERLGGKIIELPKSQWENIATAQEKRAA
jgi:hypothetical protein